VRIHHFGGGLVEVSTNTGPEEEYSFRRRPVCERVSAPVVPAGFVARVDVLCTHPMFGPESSKDDLGDLPFVYDKVRVSHEGLRAKHCERFLNIFSREGCRMVEMSCAEHDRYVAESQFITHTIGRMLGRLGLESTPISTKGYEKLLEVAWNIDGDSFDIYYGLFMYNVNLIEQLERLDMAFNSLKNEVSGSKEF
jgi:arogenate dehydrogenase (NADP+)